MDNRGDSPLADMPVDMGLKDFNLICICLSKNGKQMFDGFQLIDLTLFLKHNCFSFLVVRNRQFLNVFPLLIN